MGKPGYHRPSTFEINSAKQQVKAMPEAQRTHPTVVALATRCGVNWETLWRYARSIGAPPRNAKRSCRMMNDALIAEMVQRHDEKGEDIKDLAVEINCAVSSLYARMAKFREEKEIDLLPRPKPVFSGPRIYSSEFIRPLDPTMLTARRASPRATLGEKSPNPPEGA